MPPASASWSWSALPEQDGDRARNRWLTLFAGLALLVHLVALYAPGSPDGALELPWLPGADKVVHLLIFAVPVYLFGRLTRRVGLVAGAFAVHAVVSELVQWRFVPYRDGDPLDALVDLIGIGLAVLLLKRRPGR
jgi:VanZ family protein